MASVVNIIVDMSRCCGFVVQLALQKSATNRSNGVWAKENTTYPRIKMN